MKREISEAERNAREKAAIERKHREDDEMDSNVQVMIPAAAGTIALSYELEDDKVYRSPVIAWVVAGKNGFLIPMCADDGWVSDASDRKAWRSILLPTGHVASYEQVWDTEAEWLDDAKIKALARAERNRRREEAEAAKKPKA